MNWQDVRDFRKNGQLEKAHDAAVAILAANPDEFKTRAQLEWVIFEYIKRIVANIVATLDNSQPVDPRSVDEIMNWMRRYYRLQPGVPDMACSNILGQLVKVGPLLPKFPDIVDWVGMNGLRSEDWQSNEYQGKTYPSLAMKIARALCKWAKAHSNVHDKQMSVVLEWAERVREKDTGDELLWLNWDLAILLRQMGDFRLAAELLAGVIKAKRNEFWVWAEAGRLYQSDQPELALACFCRALTCPAESKFLVRAHRELAELLAEQGEYAQASREVAIIINIRQAEAWPIGRELEALIASSWYDPTAEGSDDPKDYYALHSAAALSLCFDEVETKSASYLGLFIPHPPKTPRPNWKPKPLPRFAIKNANGRTCSIVGPGMNNLKFEIGAPLTIVTGHQTGEDRLTIVHVSARPEGKPWDCLDQGTGVVVREAIDGKPLKVFVSESGEELDTNGPLDKSMHVGDGVRFGLARNPKNDRLNIFNVERSELSSKDVKIVEGKLRRNPKGFAFVDDAFVAPLLVSLVDTMIEDVVAVAVYGKHPKEDKRTWRAISLKAAK